MQDNRDKLYDNLVKSGKVSESEIGTRDQFKSAIKDEASAAKFHDNLLKAGFNNEEIGDSKSFYSSIASDFKPSDASPHVSQYVEGTGKNTKVFGMPYAVFQHLKPESKAYYYEEEQRKKAEAQANDIQQRAEGQYGAAINSEIDKRNKFSTEHPILSAFANVASEGTGGQMNAIESSTPVMTAKASINKAKDVKDVIDTSRRKANGTNTISEIGRGFYDKAKKLGTWDFGVSDMKENGALLSAAMKKEKGEPLSDSEKTLLESAALEALSDEKFMKDIGMPYRIGSGTAESASYMKDFLLSGGLQGLGKAAVGKFGTEAAEKTTGQIIKNAILRTAGDLVGAAGMSSTIHAGNVAGDALARKTGDVKFNQDKEGRAQFAGTGGGETTPKAIGKAFASNTINDFSEMLGEYFAPAIGKVGDVISSTKPFKALKATKVGEMLNKVSTSDWAKTVNDFEKNAQFHGTFGEYAEEVAGNAMNAAIVGDQSWSDVVDPGQNVETFLSVSLMSGIMSSSKAIGYRRPKLEAERKLSQAEDEANNVYGSQFGEIKSALENASVEDRKDYLSKVASSSMDEGKKKAIFNFVGRLTELEGMNEAEQKAEKEGSVPEGIERNKSEIYTGFEEAKKRVESVPQEELDYYEAHPEKLPESQNKDLIEDYLTAKSDFDGYLNHVSNKIQTAKENARKQVEGVANPEMNAIVRVSSKASEQPTHVVGGTLAFDDEGNVDERQSSPVIYYLDEEGKRKMAPPSMFSSLIDSTPIEDMASQAEQDAEQQIVEQEEAELPQEAPALEIGSSITTSEGITGEVTRFTPEGEAVISDGQHDYVVPSNNILSINGQSPTAPDAQSENIQEEPQNINTSVNDEENNILSENVGLNKTTQSGEQSNVSETTPAEQEENTLPLDKEGNVDYKQVSDPAVYAKALKKEFGEDALSIVEEDIANQQKQLSHAEKKGNAIEKARTKKRINQELSRLESIKSLLSPQKENEAPHDIATDEEYADWAADNSDDPIELAGAYGVAKEQSSHENILLPWQRELLGRKMNTNSFNRFGDRNKINGTFAKAWLRKDGEELDTLAQELSGFGNEVTENEIVDFMLSNPTNYVRTTSDLQKKLSGRFSEIASAEMGFSVGGPESNTGKLYLEYKKANHMIETEAQKKAFSDAVESDMIPAYERQTQSYIDFLDDEQMQALSSMRDEFEAAEYAEMLYEGMSIDEINEIYSQLNKEEDGQGEDSGDNDASKDGERLEGEQERNRTDGSEESDREAESENREDEIVSPLPQESNEDKSEKPNFVAPEIKTDESILDYASRIVKAKELSDEEQKVDANPSEAQKEAGNYKMGHVKIGGYDVTIENPKGSERKGIDNSGTPWSIKMNNSYGYFRGTKGKDGDHIDVFLGENLNPETVYVVDQVNPDGSFDEHKVMYGFNSEQEARDAYLANYEKGWTGLGNITGVSKDVFDKWLSTDTKKEKPFADYRKIEAAAITTDQESNSNAPLFRETDELEEIKDKAVADGSFMKAPNGKDSNLNDNTDIRYRGSETTMDNVANRVYRLSASFGRNINGRKPDFKYSQESGKSEYTPNSFVTDFELEASTLINTLNALKEDATDAAKEYIQGFIDRLNDQTEYYKKLDKNGGVSNQDYKALYHRSADSLNDLLRDLTSKPESKEQEAISKSVSELSDKLNTPVRLIKDMNEITDDNASLQLRKKTSKGWFDPKTGEIVIVLPNATSVADAQRTMLHEIAGHKGLRGLFGDKFDDTIDDIFKSLPDDIKKHVSEQAISKYNYDIATATEEYLAEQAESGTDPSIWNKVISAIKELFRKAGIELEMSDNDIKYLLWRSRNNLENGTIEERIDKKMRDLDIRDKLFREIPDEEKKPPVIDSNTLSKENIGDQIKIAEEAVELTDEEKKDFSAKLRNDRFREGWQDRMLPLRRFQELVSGHTGRKIEEFCDAYTNENTIASRSTYEIEQFKNDYLKPLVNAVVKLGDAELVKSYMKAKHGIERNLHMRNAAIERKQKQMDEHVLGIANGLQQDLMSLRSKKGTTQADIDKFQKKIDQTVETAKKAAIKNLSNYAIKQQSVDYAGLTGLQHRLFKQEETDPLLEDEIVLFIEEFEEDHDSKDVESLWNSVRRANTFSLNKQLSSGCIDKATKKQISEMYKYYIPLRAWSEETAGDFYDYFFKDENDVVNNPLMKANGRKSESGDPLASIASMAESAVFIGNKNEMKQHLLSLVRNYPTNMATIAPVWYRNNGDVWQEVVPELTGNREEDLDTLERFNQQMEELEKSGLAKKVTKGLSLDVPIKKWQADQHAIKVKENGKDLVIYINGDPRVAQAVNGLNNVKPFDNKLVKTQGDIKRFMTQNFTTRNPAFVLSNLSRDMIYAMTMNGIREDASYNFAFIKAIPEASSTITRYLTGKEGDGKYDKYFDEFLSNGGETGFVALTSYEQYKKEIKREIDKANGTGKMSDAFHVIAKGLSGCNRWAEDMSRFSAYIASREEGRSIVRSVKDAKELSVNFNRKGSGAGGNWLADMSYFFLNAGIQGMYNFSHTFKNYPVRTSIAMGSWMMLGAMMPLMYNILSGGDDDYDKLPDYIRQNNIVIPFFGEDNFVTIPLPIELRAFFGVGDILSQFVGGKYNDRNVGADVLGKLLDASPRNFIEGSDKGENGLVGAAFVNLTPDAIKPFVDAYITNRSFTGRPIVKKNEYNTYIPEYRKVYKGTSQMLVKSSQALNSMTGGDFATKGWADSPLLNPGAVEHLFFSYMGGVGKTILQTVKSTVGPLVGEDVALKDIPVVNRFGYQFDPAMPNSVVNERYQKYVKLLEESQSRDREYKRGLRQGFDLGDSYIEKKSDEEERRMMIVKAYKNQIDDIASLLQLADEGSSDKIKNEIADMKFKMLDELDQMDKK